MTKEQYEKYQQIESEINNSPFVAVAKEEKTYTV